VEEYEKEGGERRGVLKRRKITIIESGVSGKELKSTQGAIHARVFTCVYPREGEQWNEKKEVVHPGGASVTVT